MGVIYVRPNLINGKKYVGQATNLKVRQNRWNDLNQPYAGPAINAARAKYGIDAFDFEILKECDDKELDYWEKYYIKELNTKAPYGYNLTDGGEGMTGYTHSQETKKKLSEARKGIKLSEETKKKLSESHKGLVHSQETRKKLSDARKGIKLSEETKKKMSEANKGKHLTQVTRKKLSDANKGKHLTQETRKKLSEANKGEKNYFYGKHHSEETRKKLSEKAKGRKVTEETRKKLSENHKGKYNTKCSKPVLQIDMIANEIIAEFSSTMEVERQLGFNHRNISACCKGKRNTAGSFKWKYKEESVA